MGNMSYCRFGNTLLALEDCLNVLNDIVDGESNLKDLSLEESVALRTMVNLGGDLTAFTKEIKLMLELEKHIEMRRNKK